MRSAVAPFSLCSLALFATSQAAAQTTMTANATSLLELLGLTASLDARVLPDGALGWTSP